MSNNQQAQKFAKAIKDTYQADDVKVCWNLSQAKKYGLLSWRDGTVCFVYIKQFESGDINCPIPIAKKILFDKDNTPILLGTVGRFLMNHYELLKQAEIARAMQGVLNE